VVRRLPIPSTALLVAVPLALGNACALVPRYSGAPAPVVRGPIPARVQEPIKLTYLAFRPRRAAIQPEGSTSISVQSAYTSMFENGDSGPDQVVLDGEISRTSLILRRAVAPGADVEIELPVVYATSGFLDLIVEDFHSFFGFPSGGRDERPRFSYQMDAFHNGRLAYHLEGNEPGLGDVPIVLTHSILDESASSPALSWRTGIELPTGSESRGFGNGKVDFGAGLLAERSFGRWTATGAVDWVSAESSRSFERAGVAAQNDLDLQLGIEYRWNDGLSLLGEAVLNSPATRDIRIHEIDAGTLSIDVGAAWDLGRGSRLLLDFGEDAIADSGPDFTLLAAWSSSL
jgi:hypothetical protein